MYLIISIVNRSQNVNENEKVILPILWLYQKWKNQCTIKTSSFSTVNKTKERMLLKFIFTKSF